MKIELDLTAEEMQLLDKSIQYCSTISNSEMWQGIPQARKDVEVFIGLLGKIAVPVHEYNLCTSKNCQWGKVPD